MRACRRIPDDRHLAVALCRVLNIQARSCTGQVSGVGRLPPCPPVDIAAGMEVCLDGGWWTFDPRNADTHPGRVLIAPEHDAPDLPLTDTVGKPAFAELSVWIGRVEGAALLPGRPSAPLGPRSPGRGLWRFDDPAKAANGEPASLVRAGRKALRFALLTGRFAVPEQPNRSHRFQRLRVRDCRAASNRMAPSEAEL
ncbi:MAG TPA: hypothetical protein DIU07_00835 [Rhodobacteraceae bacterium]|nr:hypothetical protein [Paracoccaceae bacterium]